MDREGLYRQITQKQSFLCVGLDPDVDKMPLHLRDKEEGILLFNQSIIEATKDYCVAYKLNTAFYEAHGAKGWEILRHTVSSIPDSHFVIADAKRGDIGNTSSFYAKSVFDHLGVDAVTVNPYMGEDSLRPFLERKDKWAIVLALTSNPGSADFQQLKIDSEKLYEKVILKVMQWGTPDQIMFVIGATQTSELAHIRKLVPDHFLLVPGVGAQGGNLGSVARSGMNKQCGLLVNMSRSVLYASREENFATAARNEAVRISEQMAQYLR